MIKKSAVMAILKSLGYGTVKMTATKGAKVFRDVNGESHKGIFSVSLSPMDVTDVKFKKARADRESITQALRDIGLEVETGSGATVFRANSGTKQQFQFIMFEETFPSYAREMGYDPGYVSVYFTFTFPEK